MANQLEVSRRPPHRFVPQRPTSHECKKAEKGGRDILPEESTCQDLIHNDYRLGNQLERQVAETSVEANYHYSVMQLLLTDDDPRGARQPFSRRQHCRDDQILQR